MRGFKNSTKTVPGHHFAAGGRAGCPSCGAGSTRPGGVPGKVTPPAPVTAGGRDRFAKGGIVAPMAGPRMPKTSGPRPILPRPRAMPNMKMESMPKVKLAKGGIVGDNHRGDGGGGPYNPEEGNSLAKANRPYSQIEKEHPRNDARPGYAGGGKKGKNLAFMSKPLFGKG